MGTWHNIQKLKISIYLLGSILIVIAVYHVLRSAGSVTKSSYYTVVLDCGSTGTRVHVYEWLVKSSDDEDLPVMLHSFPDNSMKSPLEHGACKYHCVQTEPGLDKFLHNSSGITSALEPLLVWAEHQVPYERHEETPIFLLATAGLRRLPKKDADWILDNAVTVLKKHQFAHIKNWIRILTGKEEAYYGWVALNYKMGKFGNNSSVLTLGVLDLGGSSLQVVLEIRTSRKNRHFLESEIGSLGHQLLAYSLPAFGLNAAFERSVIILSDEQFRRKDFDGTFEIKHPCLYSGYVQNYTCYGCHVWSSATNSLNVSVQLWNREPRKFYLVGDPDWERCRDLSRATAINSSSSDWWRLSVDMDCEAHSSSRRANSPNSMHTLPMPSIHALSGFFAVYNMLNLNVKANTTELLQRGQQLCSRSWAEIKTRYGTRHFMEQSCFRVPYLSSLIEDGLCLNDAEIIFGPGDVSWTLGAALVEGNAFWSSRKHQFTSSFGVTYFGIVYSPTFLIGLFLFIVFVFYCWKRKRSTVTLLVPTQSKRSPGVISLPSHIYAKKQLN